MSAPVLLIFPAVIPAGQRSLDLRILTLVDLTVAVAPGAYDTANGEVFPLVVPSGVTLLGDEDNRGQGTTVQGEGSTIDTTRYAVAPN